MSARENLDGRIVIHLEMTPRGIRKLCKKVPTRNGRTLADLFDSLVESLVNTAGLSKNEAESFVAKHFFNFMKDKGWIPHT